MTEKQNTLTFARRTLIVAILSIVTLIFIIQNPFEFGYKQSDAFIRQMTDIFIFLNTNNIKEKGDISETIKLNLQFTSRETDRQFYSGDHIINPWGGTLSISADDNYFTITTIYIDKEGCKNLIYTINNMRKHIYDLGGIYQDDLLRTLIGVVGNTKYNILNVNCDQLTSIALSIKRQEFKTP